MVMSGSDLGMRRRRALWRATHRGSKEMDFLLGRFAEAAVSAVTAPRGRDEIAHAGEAGERLGTRAELRGESSHFREAAREKRGLG